MQDAGGVSLGCHGHGEFYSLSCGPESNMVDFV